MKPLSKDIHVSRLRSNAQLAVFVSMAFVSVDPVLAAGIISAGGAEVYNKGNVEVVNIVAPNQHGLSHNQYQQYNVNQPGVVLNNSVNGGQSVLAGQLAANGKLGGNAARLILNEVVGANPSLLLGKQEVFGMLADYVLANPNGITSKDSGFINTGRASLVVGSPVLQDGRLDSVMLGNGAGRNGRLQVTGQLDGARVLDLLAPKIELDGIIRSEQAINVLAGRNEVRLTPDQGLQLSAMRDVPPPPPPPPPKREICILPWLCIPDLLSVFTPPPSQPAADPGPAQVLDSRVLGSLQSGRIRLYNTDQSATTTVQASINAQQGLAADMAGKLVIQGSHIQAGDADLRAGSLKLAALRQQQDQQQRDSTGGLKNLLQLWTLDTDKASHSEQLAGSELAVRGQARLEARQGPLQVDGSKLSADRLQLISSGDMDIAAAKATDSLRVRETSSGMDKAMQVVETTRNESRDKLLAATLNGRDIELKAGGQLGISAATVTAANALDVQAGKVVLGSQVTAQQQDSSSRRTDNILALGSLSLLTTHEESQADTQRTEQLHVSKLTAANRMSLASQGDIVASGSKLQAASLSMQGQNITLQQAAAESSQGHKERRADLLNLFNTDTAARESRQQQVETVAINGNDINLAARGQLSLNGAAQRESRQSETTYGLALKQDGSNFGHDRQAWQQEQLVAANVAGRNVQLTAGGQMQLDGSRITAEGDVKLQAGELRAGTVATRNSDSADRHSIGLLHSVRDSRSQVEDKQHGSEIRAGKQLTVQAGVLDGKGVVLSGANATVGGGKLQLTHALDSQQASTLHREATGFDLLQTTMDSRDSLHQAVKGSLIQARQGDASINADQVALTASRVEASGNARVIAKGDIVLQGASEQHEQRNKTWRPSADFYVSQEGTDWEKELGARVDLKEVLESVLDRAVTADEDLQFRLGVRANGKTHETVARQVLHQGSAVSAGAGQAYLQADKVALSGSRLQADADEASIQARDIALTAGKLQRITEDNLRTDGIGPYVSAGVNRVAAGVDAVTFQYNVHDEDNKAAVSNVRGKSVWLLGSEKIASEGAQLRADGDVSVWSGSVRLENATDDTLHQITQPRLGAEADIFLKYSPSVGAQAAVFGKLDVARDFTTTAVGTRLEGGSIQVRGNGVRDRGTVYQANKQATVQGRQYNNLDRGDVLIKAGNYENFAAENSQYSTRDKIKGRFELQAYTSTFQDVTIKGILSGGARHEESGKAQAVKGMVVADDLTIDAAQRAVTSSDARLSGNYTVKAGSEATIAQARDRSWLDRQGFNASVGIGAKVFPAGMGATLPVINLKGDFNTKTVRDVSGVGADIAAANLVLTGAQMALVEGAKVVTPGDVTMQGARTHYDAAYGSHLAQGISAGGSFDFAPLDGALGNLGVSADLDFIDESGSSAKGGSVQARKLLMQADSAGEAASIVGAKLQLAELDISNKRGGVGIVAAQSDSRKANFGGGFKFGIGIDKKSLNSLTVGGRIDVDFDKVRTIDQAVVNSQRITLNSAQDARLVGADIQADSLQGKVGGNLQIGSLAQMQDRKRLLVDVGLGGAPAKIETAKDGAGVVRDALLDGTLFGFNGHANIDAQYVDYVKTQPSQLRLGKLSLPVAGKVTVDAASVHAAKGSHFGGAPLQATSQANKDHRAGVTLNVSTNLFKMVKQGVDDIRAGKFPLIQAHFKWEDSVANADVDLKP